MAPLLIETIVVSERVNAKLNQLHGLSFLDVEDAVERREKAAWGTNEAGTERLLLVCRLPSGVRVNVVLYPTSELGVWNLATAFPVQ